VSCTRRQRQVRRSFSTEKQFTFCILFFFGTMSFATRTVPECNVHWRKLCTTFDQGGCEKVNWPILRQFALCVQAQHQDLGTDSSPGPSPSPGPGRGQGVDESSGQNHDAAAACRGPLERLNACVQDSRCDPQQCSTFFQGVVTCAVNTRAATTQ
jgi:hypothetical protein